MVKSYYIKAIVSFLLIPVVTVLGGMVFCFINPEIGAGTPHYVLIYRLLDMARRVSMLATFLVDVGLWFLTCFFLIKSKKQSNWWLPLAILGPFGFIGLTMLRNNADQPLTLCHQFVRRMNVYLRVAYELCMVYVVWELAYDLMVLKRNLAIKYEAATTGVSQAQIINQQNASGGMWAFSEGLEVLFLVVLLYLFWPICFNVVGHLLRLWPSRRKEPTRSDRGN